MCFDFLHSNFQNIYTLHIQKIQQIRILRHPEFFSSPPFSSGALPSPVVQNENALIIIVIIIAVPSEKHSS
jgi:hypothetical protein